MKIEHDGEVSLQLVGNVVVCPSAVDPSRELTFQIEHLVDRAKEIFGQRQARNEPLVLNIVGHPASGKSILARVLAQSLPQCHYRSGTMEGLHRQAWVFAVSKDTIIIDEYPAFCARQAWITEYLQDYVKEGGRVVLVTQSLEQVPDNNLRGGIISMGQTESLVPV